MDKVWLDSRREQLMQQKAELLERVDKIKADIGKGLDADSKEQVIQLENGEVLDALGNEATAEISRISLALQSLDTASYGVCTACGEPIDRLRLEARPYSTKCIDCASDVRPHISGS
jgi:DnaK suppressor protein